MSSTHYPGHGARPQPVMMIPLRRCGSHALRLRLNLSPQFYGHDSRHGRRVEHHQQRAG